MLRWKTLSALCTIAIAVCPLTSFAQQIEMSEQQTAAFNRALQPLRNAHQVRTNSAGVVSPDVVIRAPFVQPHNPHLYLFVVENVGNVDATVAAVDLYVPQDITITNVVPAPKSGNAQWAHIRLTNLAAGSKSIIEVAISPTPNAVEFSTRMALESVQNFSAEAKVNYQVAAKPNPTALSTEVVRAMLQEAAQDSKYLIPAVQASHVPSSRSVAAKNVHAVQAQAVKLPAPAAQAAVDEKLIRTVASLRLAGQDALADAYIAAVANSKTCRAETF